MSLGIVVDTFEPLVIKEELKKSLPTSVVTLAKTGYSDYLWTAADGHVITAERKEVHDFASRVDDLEIQLKNALKAVGERGEVILIIEGIMEPAGSSTVLFRAKRDGSMFFRERVVNRPFAYFMNFIYALDKQGISVYWTASLQSTAAALVSFVTESNKAEFTTFRRYIKKKPNIPNLNPQVAGLLNLCHGIGVVRAQALIGKFGTVYKVLTADKSKLLTVTGIGEGVVKQIFTDIGRK